MGAQNWKKNRKLKTKQKNHLEYPLFTRILAKNRRARGLQNRIKSVKIDVQNATYFDSNFKLIVRCFFNNYLNNISYILYMKS